MFAFMIMFGLGICMVLPSTQLSTSLYYCGVIISATFFASLSEKARTRIGFSVLFGMSFLILFLHTASGILLGLTIRPTLVSSSMLLIRAGGVFS